MILLSLLAACGRLGDTGPPTPPNDSTSPLDTGVPQSFEVTGVVYDVDGQTVADAMVLVGGQPDTMVYTDEDGFFSLWFTDYGLGEPAIAAAKLGYRSRGYEFLEPDTPISITIREVKAPDNIDYHYEYPGTGFDMKEEYCSHCHTGFVQDFVASKHAESARNPLLQDLYAGVSQAHSDAASCEDAGGRWATGLEPGEPDREQEKCYIGGGVLPDLNDGCGDEDQPVCDALALAEDELPTEFGACADCHAPAMNGVAGGRDLHDAIDFAYDLGVHCDFCHKVKDIDLSAPPGTGGRLVMGRPGEVGTGIFDWEPVYYGPLMDVPNVVMGGSHQPVFNESTFCAGCHEQNQDALLPGEALDTDRWPDGLPVHSTYTEWSEGPYNQDTTQCQWCHMPADVDATNAVDITTPETQSITFGFQRPPEDIRQHLFRGPLQGDPRLIDQALYVSVALTEDAETLTASVSVANVGCGHAVPTGEPMRALVLVVEAEGDCGALQATDGMTINDIGGALASGTVGVEAQVSAATVVWPAAAAVAEPGQVIRSVLPTGEYNDYDGIGLFSGTVLSAEEKGLPIDAPGGAAVIASIDGDTITLDAALDTSDGDILYLADAWDGAVDGADAQHLAGLPGYTFARVMLDAAGERQVPHYRAVDIASDNRLAPGSNTVTTHTFALPTECAAGAVTATVLYRPVPLQLAAERGWSSTDHVIATGAAQWP